MAQISIEAYRKIFLGAIIVVILFVVGLFAARFFFAESFDIQVNTVPPKAQVSLTGDSSTAPLILADVREGVYTAKVSKEGYFDRKEKIEVGPDSREFFVRIYPVSTAPSSLSADIRAARDVRQNEIDKLLRFLPAITENYRIELQLINRIPAVQISLLGIINRPDQFESFQRQQRENAEEALEYIVSKKVDPEKLNIVWFPENPLD